MQINKVMLVDDENSIRTIGKIALSKPESWEVITISAGTEAVAAAAVHKPDLILLDVMMPEMDGPAVLKALKASGESEKIPVIFLTAEKRAEEVVGLLQLGAVGIIGKPFNPRNLQNEVKRITAQL